MTDISIPREALEAAQVAVIAALEEVTQWSKPHDRVNIIARAVLEEKQ